MSLPKKVYIPIILLLLASNAFSQYYVKSKDDSTAFEIDSLILMIDDLPGIIDWEVSKDTLSWNSLNQNNDTIYIRIDSSAYYRAKLTVGTCYPVNSEIALVSFKSVTVTGNSVTIDSTGCVYEFPTGLKIIVPPGAVEEDVTISFELLDSINAALKIPFDADTGKVYCTGVYCEPAGTQFLKPISIRLPAPDYRYVDIPYVYLYDSGNNMWDKRTDNLICSQYMQFIEFTTDKLISARIHLLKDFFVFDKSAKSPKGGMWDWPDWWPWKDCKEGLAYYKSMASDYGRINAGEECYISSDDITVLYDACTGNQRVATAKVEEISTKCKVEVQHELDKNCLRNGEKATLTITVTIGNKPLKDQKVYVYDLPPGLTVDNTFPETNDLGIAKCELTCHVNKFNGTIKFKVDYEYYLHVTQASSGGMTEAGQEFKQGGLIELTETFFECPYLNQIILNSSCGYTKVCEPCQLYTTCLDQYGNPIECGDLEYEIISKPSGTLGGVGEGGVVIFQQPGMAEISAKIPALGIVSNPIFISAAYEGDASVFNVKDYSQQWFEIMCGCPEGHVGEPEFKYYKMTYIANLHISFWLNAISESPPIPQLTGTAQTIYEIESDICLDMIWPEENITCYESEVLYNSSIGRVPTTDDILNGIEFQVMFSYFNFRNQLVLIQFSGQLSGEKIYLHQMGGYVPETCVGYIYDIQFTLQGLPCLKAEALIR